GPARRPRRRRTPAAAHLRRRAPLGQRRVVAAVAGVDLLLPAAPLLHAAAHGAVALGQLLGHDPRPAARAGLGHRPVPGHELARRIAAAAVEELAAPRAALHELALAAAEELAPPAPLDDHRLAALLAHEVGRALLALHVAHLDLGLLEVLGERPPEAAERVDVVLLAFLDAVELVLHAGRELDVQHVGERLDEEVGHQKAELRRLEAPLVVLEHVLLVEDGAHDAGIGGRAPDALLLELLPERRLHEAGRQIG